MSGALSCIRIATYLPSRAIQRQWLTFDQDGYFKRCRYSMGTCRKLLVLTRLYLGKQVYLRYRNKSSLQVFLISGVLMLAAFPLRLLGDKSLKSPLSTHVDMAILLCAPKSQELGCLGKVQRGGRTVNHQS